MSRQHRERIPPLAAVTTSWPYIAVAPIRPSGASSLDRLVPPPSPPPPPSRVLLRHPRSRLDARQPKAVSREIGCASCLPHCELEWYSLRGRGLLTGPSSAPPSPR